MTTQPVSLDALIQYVLSQHPDGDALIRLRDAMLVSQQLSDHADTLIGHFVDQARRAGAPWSAIGEAMGVTKQAAQKRFVPSLAGLETDSPSFSRFTPRARNALNAAQAEAARLGAPAVGTQHLLLGLLIDPDGLAAKALTALGASAEQIRARAESAPAAPAGSAAEPGERVPFSEGAKQALQLTLREALALGHNYIGTEHMLLGILAEAGAGAAVLTGLGISGDSARAWLTQALADLAARLGKGGQASG